MVNSTLTQRSLKDEKVDHPRHPLKDSRPIPHLALHRALAVSPDAAAGAAARVPGARRLPGALPGGAVVVEMPAAQVLVRLPVTQDVQRGAGGHGGQVGLGDLQLLEVGVDRRVGPALACG